VTPQRLRLLSFALIAVGAGILALAWSQPWHLLRLHDGEVEAGGEVAGGALLPLGLASLALIPALALAGPFFRVVLAVLDALLGACAVVVAIWSIADPVRASYPALTEATGLASLDAVREQVESVASTAWPSVGLAAGVLVILTGTGIAVTSRVWPAPAARFSRSRLTTVDGDPIDDWDALSGGDDPTARSPLDSTQSPPTKEHE